MAYRPQSNSSIETKNSIVYKCLRIYCKNKDEWDTFLPKIQLAHNATSVADSRQFSPYFIVFGKECPFIIDHNIIPDQRESVEISEFVKTMLPKMKAMRVVVRDNIEEYKKYSEKYFDKDTKPKYFEPGMKDWREVKQFQLHIPKKLQQKYVGPYYIADLMGESTYRLMSCEANELYKIPSHVERLRNVSKHETSEIRSQEHKEDHHLTEMRTVQLIVKTD